MGLIITGDLGPRRCFVTNVPYYTKSGVGKHFPAELAAAYMLPIAKKEGFDEIVVEQQGQRPKSYSIFEVERMVKRNPALMQTLSRSHPTGAAKQIRRYDARFFQ